MGQTCAKTNRVEQLLAEHRALDLRVQELVRRMYLTPEEEREVRNLKKRKLAKKDLIVALGTATWTSAPRYR